MQALGYVVVMLVALFASAPASAQDINGESTYGDSDLHQPPETSTSPPEGQRGRDARAAPRDNAERR